MHGHLRELRPGGNHTLTGHWEPSGNVAAQMGKGPNAPSAPIIAT